MRRLLVFNSVTVDGYFTDQERRHELGPQAG